MDKVIFAIFGIALFMLPTNGETTQKRKPLSMAERVALQKRIALKRTGGIVRKENSANRQYYCGYDESNAQSRGLTAPYFTTALFFLHCYAKGGWESVVNICLRCFALFVH